MCGAEIGDNIFPHSEAARVRVRMSLTGHEERLSARRLSGRCSFRKQSLAADDRVGSRFGQPLRDADAKGRHEFF